MSDFSTPSEKRRSHQREQEDYRKAFWAAETEIAELKKIVAGLTEQQASFRGDLTTLLENQAADKKALVEKVDAGLSKLDEDNKRLHALIQSAQDNDLKLVEQMDKNHRERMSEILKLVEQKANPNV